MKAKNVITLDEVPGGHYTCQDNGDGTWNMLDVPIMGEMFEGEKDVPFDLGRDWHKAALRKGQERELEGHWGSTHVHHHEKGSRTERAGYLRLRRVGSCWHDGREMSCLYADLIRIPKAIFDRIDKAELPYRSVEVASWEEPEIASLALMPDETPFFRLPMLTTGSKVKASEPIKCNAEYAPAYTQAEKGGFILFKLGGPMAKKTEQDEPKKSLKERILALFKANPKAADEDIEKVVKGEIDNEGLPGEQDDLESGRFATKPEEQTDSADTEGEPAPATDVKGKKVEKKERESVREMATLAAEVDVLKKDKQTRERKDKVDGIVAKAKKDLGSRYLSADTEAKLRRLADKDLTGETVAEFVDVYKKIQPPDDTEDDVQESRERFGRSEPVSTEEPTAVAAFAAKGPEAHSRARKLAADFDYAQKTGHVPASMKLETYIDINMKLPQMGARK